MLRFDHHTHTGRTRSVHYRMRDLFGELFLNLQTARKHVADACDFRQADHFAQRQISHMDFADERQQVMFAHRIQFDVFDDDHFVVVRIEHGAIQHLIE